MAPYGGSTQAGKSEDQELPTVIKEGPYTRCRIVAVCGVNNHEDNASPIMDGWFISDFYMLYHLLKPVSEFQTWLTCLEPELLVKKYGPFFQGNPCTDDRRVVLDNDMLPNLANITCVDEQHLLQQLLWTIAGESTKAAENAQTLVMIFIGHGESKSSRIVVGGPGDQTKALRNMNRLEQSVVENHLHPNARATLVTTSCYSGGWVVSPLFNASMLAGTTRKGKTVSFPQAGHGRACGSPFASAVIEAMVKLNISGLNVGDGRDELNPKSCSYTALIKAVPDNYVEREGYPHTKPTQPTPTFASHNDNWGEDFSQSGLQISGLQAIDYCVRWNALKKVPKSGNKVGVAVTGSVSTIGSRRFLTPDAARQVLQQKATKYLDLFPGIPNESANITTHSYCQEVLDLNINLSPNQMETRGRTLDYRLYDIMERATMYKKALQVDFPDCDDWDSEMFLQSYAKDKKLSQKMDQPMEGKSSWYDKGEKYLAAIVFSQKWSHDEALGRLTQVKFDWKEKTGKVVCAIRELCLRDSVKETGKCVIIPSQRL